MALLLKKKAGNTIKSRLTGYMRTVFWIAFLVLIGFSILHLASVVQYQENMDRVLTLNDFFTELDHNYQLLKQYVDNSEAGALETLETSNEALKEKNEQLQKLQISSSFSRDIADLAAIFYHYEERNEEILRRIDEGSSGEFSTQDAEEVVLLYEEAGEIYEMMTSQYKDLHLTLIGGVNEVQQELNRWMVRYYIVLIGVILVFIFASSRHASTLSDKIAQPIEALDAAANLVRSGQLDQFQDVEIPQPSYEEINSLAAAFNTMVRQLQDHIQVMEENAKTAEKLHRQEMENLRIASLLKASELKALQMQMNPHFLFNTLNMISRTADLGDTDRTVLLLQKTAQLLRYNLDYSGKTVTLAKEIEMLGNYVFLQEQRFGNRISFDFELDERFHQIQVPCFILQPLVENAVIHGLGGSGGKGTIIIRTRYLEEEGEGWISILDDGEGMSEESREQVLQNLDSDKEQREKIGLANINMRLRLLLEDRYKMEIFSAPGEGTEIRIHIFLSNLP